MAQYGWTIDYVYDHLTLEQIVYLAKKAYRRMHFQAKLHAIETIKLLARSLGGTDARSKH